ncbi:MAG: hypothetical protein ACP6IU_11790 [Candidatus Asgardarchaeia archaeon]
MSKASKRNPKYIKALIKNAFEFYKCFLVAVLEKSDETTALEIVQKDLITTLKEDIGRKYGEITVIKYVNELKQWGFLRVDFKERNNRFSKHLRPTAKGIMLTKLYDPSWFVSKRLQTFVEEKIPTVHVLFRDGKSISEYNKMLENPTLLDICTVFGCFSRMFSAILFEKFLIQETVTDLQLIKNTFNMLEKKRLNEVSLEEYIRHFIPKDPFDKFAKTINNLTLFSERLNSYIITAIYFTIKKELEKEPQKYYGSDRKYCLEFSSIIKAFNEVKYKSASLSPLPCKIDAFGLVATQKSNIEKVSNILGKTPEDVEHDALHLYLEDNEYRLSTEIENILKKHDVKSLRELRNLIDSGSLRRSEVIEDVNKLKALEEELMKIRSLKNDLKRV